MNTRNPHADKKNDCEKYTIIIYVDTQNTMQ